MTVITHRSSPVPTHEEPLAQAAFCAVCPKLCRPTCPVQRATGREAVAPWRISDAVVRGTTQGWTLPLATQVASCTGCLACAEPCLPGTNLPEESRAARAAAASGGAVLPAAQRLRERLATTGSPRRPSTVGNDVASSTVRFLGCPARSSRSGAAAARLAPALRCDADERCCGAVAYDLGLLPEATALATAAAASLRDAEQVVVVSPSCARMMRDEWPRLGVTPPPVTTAVEWLAAADLGYRRAGAVTWHAPCTLTRALGVGEAALHVLRALSDDVREPEAGCSGAGAAYGLIDPDGAEAVAAARRAELASFGAPVVTACPSAARALGATDLFVLAADRRA